MVLYLGCRSRTWYIVYLVQQFHIVPFYNTLKTKCLLSGDVNLLIVNSTIFIIVVWNWTYALLIGRASWPLQHQGIFCEISLFSLYSLPPNSPSIPPLVPPNVFQPVYFLHGININIDFMSFWCVPPYFLSSQLYPPPGGGTPVYSLSHPITCFSSFFILFFSFVFFLFFSFSPLLVEKRLFFLFYLYNLYIIYDSFLPPFCSLCPSVLFSLHFSFRFIQK